MIQNEIIVNNSYENRLKYSWSNFQKSVQSNPELRWICLTISFDWSRKLAPSSRPIRCKAKINRDLITRVFPRVRSVTSICSEF